MADWLDQLEADEQAEWERLVEHFRRDALEKMDESAFVASLVPKSDKFDVKFAMETGAAILLGKPILAIVMPGAELPGKLALVADEVVEADMDTEEGRNLVHQAISRMTARLEWESKLEEK